MHINEALAVVAGHCAGMTVFYRSAEGGFLPLVNVVFPPLAYSHASFRPFEIGQTYFDRGSCFVYNERKSDRESGFIQNKFMLLDGLFDLGRRKFIQKIIQFGIFYAGSTT